MEENLLPAATTRSVGIRYGLIMSLFSIAVFLAFALSGADMSAGTSRLAGLPVLIVIIYLAQKNFMDNGDSYMSYGQGMGVTFWIGLISSTIYSAFLYVYIRFIDGTFIERIMQTQMDKMREGGMSDEQIEQATGFTKVFMTPGFLVLSGFFGAIISTLICGLIVTAFTQKNSH